MSFGFQQYNDLVPKVTFFLFSKFFVLEMFVGSLYPISTKIKLQYVEFFSKAIESKSQMIRSIQEGGNITFDFMVSKLRGDKRMSFFTSLMVSTVIGLELILHL